MKRKLKFILLVVIGLPQMVLGQTYTVTEIASDAFAYTSRLEKITIPATIIRIGEYAFTGTNLMSVDFLPQHH